MIDAARQFPELMSGVQQAISRTFPIESVGHLMSIADLRWEDYGSDIKDNIALHKDYKLKGKTLAAKLHGTVEIRTKEGKVVDRVKDFILAVLPHITSRSSYIVNGHEVQTVNQLRLKPGPYTRFTVSNDTETFINAAGGGYRIVFERLAGRLLLRSGTSNIPLYPILKSLGITDREMSQAWGDEVFGANQKLDKEDALPKLYQKMRKFSDLPVGADLVTAVDSFFRSKKLDPRISKITLGKEYDQISPQLLLDASRKAVELANGNAQADDTESLAFKSIHSVEDMVPEKIDQASSSLKREIAYKMDKDPRIARLLSPASFSSPILSWFETSEFTRYSDQNNPLDMASTVNLTTTMGEGGIQSTHAVKDELRLVHPSHMGFLDPLHSPEGQKIGITGHLALGADKRGTDLIIRLYDAKTGQLVTRTPQDIENATIAFNDQYDMSGKRPRPKTPLVKAKVGYRMAIIPAAKVEYIFKDPKGFFSIVTNAIPFLHNNSPNRVLMADRHIEQSVALKDPDVPIVQSRFSGNTGYHDFFGQSFCPRAPIDGTVTKITKDQILVKGPSGTHTVYVHDHYPLNADAFLHDTPIVKVGDKVKKGQTLAENNFTKGKALSFMKYLNTAYVAYKGYNYEDGVVISEAASKKLTSVHKHDLKIDRTSTMKIGLKIWAAHYPDKAAAVDKTKFDPEGLIKKGAEIVTGMPVIPAVDQIQINEEMAYAKLHKSLANPWRDCTVYWEEAATGVVIDVVKTVGFIRVILQTEEPAQIGDKVSNSGGGKGIIVHILPDNEMLQSEDGKPLDLLLNPGSVAGRVNPGQLFEGAAAKIANKTGKKYLIDSFSNQSSLQKIKDELKANGLKDTESVTDPVTGNVLDNVFVAPVPFFKLKHQVRHKFSAKGLGPYTGEQQPAKVSGAGESAQNIGTGELYALMSGGSTHFLKDVATIKSQSNPEYWRAVQTGMPLPPPKTPYILDKFISYLEGAGTHVTQEGSNLKVLPMTDKEVMSRSKGAITSPGVVRATDLRPEMGGLFDRAVTGGFGGTSWAHIDLESPMPNPLMERPIISLTGIKPAEFKQIMAGNLFVTKDGKMTTDHTQGKGAGEGLQSLLEKIDVDKDLTLVKAQVRTAKFDALDVLNKKRRYLEALKTAGLSPSEAYIQRKIPVIPASFRPIYPLPDGALNVADANHSYREILMINNQLLGLKRQGVDDKNLAGLRADLYGALQGMTGVTEPLTRGANFKGFIATIKGRQNKYGLFQGKVVKRPQDLSARSTAIPNPKFGLDTVGLPEEMALTIYRPFLVRRLSNAGIAPLAAGDLIDKRDPRALAALQLEVKERPVYLNRAPTLHKFGLMAFKPVIVQGKAIQTNPLINSGYNLDYDGDQQYFHVIAFLSESAILMAKASMGDAFIEDRRMTARFNLTIPAVKGGDLFLFHLEDFPVGKKIKTTEGEKGPIEWFEAIPGTQVVAYDEQSGKSVWANVTLWSKHLDRLIETIELESGRQIFADDDPRAVYGIETDSMVFVRHGPADAVRTKMWVPRLAELESAPGGATWMPVLEEGGRMKLNGTFDLDFDLGYLLGAAAGDGWCVHAHGVEKGLSIAYGLGGEAIVERCDSIIPRLFDGTAPEKGIKNGGSYGESITATWSSMALGSFIAEQLGCGAASKHLPPCFMSTPLAFRKGLFAGLMDTDGSVAVSHAKKKPQLMGNISSTSLRLLQETRLLAASLGVDSRITPSKTPAGLPFWCLGLCSLDLKRWGGEGMVHPGKLNSFAEAKSIDDERIAPRADVVPITKALASFIRDNIPAPRNAPKKQKSLYVIFSNARDRMSIARAVVDDLLMILSATKIVEHPDGARWLSIVTNKSIKWDRAVGFTKTEMRKTGFDLTVPGFETFMSADGVVLSNTMGVHVPVSEEARKEAFTKMPSNHLMSVTGFGTVHAPTREYSLGLYLMSFPKGDPVKAASVADMISKYQNKLIKINTPVVIGGTTWTTGQALINDVLPSDAKLKNTVVDKKVLLETLRTIGRNHSKEAGDIISKLKDLGAHYVTEVGYSIGLDDLSIDYKKRDAILASAAKQAKTVGFDKAYTDAVDKIQTLVKEHKDNRFVVSNIISGAFGKGDQVAQMIATPVAMAGHKGEIIKVPITKSFAEGHDIASYWATIPGSRKGLMERGLGTQDVGALSKRLVNTTIQMVVSESDCGTQNGVDLPTDSREALDRVIATGPNKGKVLTPELARTLKARGMATIRMRSPLKCVSTKGVCQKCYGLSENGQFLPIGFPVGALIGQAVSEPVIQTMLRGFHTGGAVSKSAVGFDRIEQLFEMPENVPGQATLAMANGAVSKVAPGIGGGWNVTVDNRNHFVPKELGLGVKKGDKVVAGQRLSSSGIIKPQDLLEATGDINRVRDQIITDLDKEYSSGGVKVRRKMFEAAIRPMTDRAEVLDAGDGERLGIHRGDVLSINRINEVNQRLDKGKKVVFRSTLLPIRISPFKGEDFIGKLMFERPHETLREAPAIGASVNLTQGHPVTQFAMGVFRKK